ncbi:membrane cofactor protein-like isoform X3 [Pleurodeles waltl]|uniref:membrane cofactor protein-like isoform X3 n=1 Tax=Pleurodeles waltl TaxID=8319 RepID=UPI003709B796
MSPIFSLCLLSFASSLLPWVVAPGNCPLPTRFEYGELEEQYLSLTEFPIGTTVTYKCRPGYILIRGKEKSITCLDTSAWSVIPEFCERRDCGSPGELLNGEFHLPVIEATGELDTKFGSTATFTCNAGYKLLGRNTRTCGVSGWDNRVPICEVVVCFKPPDLQNGTHTDVDREEFMYQSAVVYTCNPGFSLIGKSTISCTANGTWSDLAPTCKIVSCSAPSVPNGEKISGFGPGPFKYKETVTFKCKEDFYMNGTALVQCNENSDWDPSLPSCVFRMPTSTTPATMTVTRKPDEKEDFSASTVQTTSSLFTKSKASTTQSTKDNNSKGPDGDNGAAHLIVGNMTLILAILVVKWLMLYSRS